MTEFGTGGEKHVSRAQPRPHPKMAGLQRPPTFWDFLHTRAQNEKQQPSFARWLNYTRGEFFYTGDHGRWHAICWRWPNFLCGCWYTLTTREISRLIFARDNPRAGSGIQYRYVTQGAPWLWKVMEFRKTIYQAWNVMESIKSNQSTFVKRHKSRANRRAYWKIAKVMESHGKVMENDDNVVKFLLLHWAIL